MIFNPWCNKGGWNKIQPPEIEKIISVYKVEGSILKTAIATGYSKNTVNKAVKKLSSEDKRSRYNNIPVYKYSLDGKLIAVYKNANQASVRTHISASNINQALNHKTNSAGGYLWFYENDLENFKIPAKVHVSGVREMDILLGLV